MPSGRAGWCRPTSPSSRRSCRRDEKQAHLLLVVDGAVVPPGGRPGVTVLDLSGRSAETDDNTVLRLPVDATDRPVRPRHSRGPGPAARPLAPRRWVGGRPKPEVDAHGPAGPRRRTPVRPGIRLACASGARPAAGADRPRRRRRADPPRPQGGRPEGDGAARPARGRDRLRQVRAAAHPGARPGAHPLPRAAEPGARRLQGRRDLRRDVGAAPRLGVDHQPRRRARPRRPDAGRPVR